MPIFHIGHSIRTRAAAALAGFAAIAALAPTVSGQTLNNPTVEQAEFYSSFPMSGVLIEELQPDGIDGSGEAKTEETEPSAQEKLEERLSLLEAKFEKDEKAAAEAKKAAKQKPTFKLGGRIHFDYWNFMENDPGIGFFENSNPAAADFGDDPEDRLLFRRIRLEMQGTLPENMLWRMQVDFNNPAVAEYKDVYFGWSELPGNHTFLVGNQKRPLGLDHLNSSRFNVFMERPFVVEAFNEDARRIGAAFYGVRDDQSANWRLGIYNLENTSTDGRYIGDSMQLGAYGRYAASPWYDETSGGRGYFHWAIAGAVAKPDGDTDASETNSNEGRFRTRPLARSDSRWLDTGAIAGADWYEVLAFETILNVGRFQFTAEYMANFMQRDNITPGTGDDLFFHGFYAYASYFLTGEHMTYDRESSTLGRVKPFENFFLVERLRGGTARGWGALQIAARYDYLDLTDSDIRGGVGSSTTLGLNWHWTAYSKIQANLIHGDISNHRPVGGFEGGDYWIGGLRYMCDF